MEMMSHSMMFSGTNTQSPHLTTIPDTVSLYHHAVTILAHCITHSQYYSFTVSNVSVD